MQVSMATHDAVEILNMYLSIYLPYPPGREGGEGAKDTTQARFEA